MNPDGKQWTRAELRAWLLGVVVECRCAPPCSTTAEFRENLRASTARHPHGVEIQRDVECRCAPP